MQVDPALVERARRGDDAAFEALVDQTGDRSFSIAFRIIRERSRAEDAVQQAYLLAWRQLPTLRETERFGAWLDRLLINACYGELRRDRRWRVHVRVLPIDLPSAADPFGAVHDRDAIERAYADLSPEQRSVFVLHHHVGMPLAEIAAVVGAPAGTVKSRLHYATRVMRAVIDDRARGAGAAQTREERGA